MSDDRKREYSKCGFKLDDYVAHSSVTEKTIGGSDEIVGFTHGGHLILQGYGDSTIKTVIPQSVRKVDFPPKPLPEIRYGKTF